MKTFALFLFVILTSLPVMAHPGHGQASDSFSMLHYLTQPVHLMGGVAMAGGIITIIFWLKKIKEVKE